MTRIYLREMEITKIGGSQETASDGGAEYSLLRSVLIIWATWVSVVNLLLIRINIFEYRSNHKYFKLIM